AALPKGVIVVTMPRLSDTMTNGTVATWIKKVGDKVAEGDILAEIETDKATMEFESFNSGTLLHIGVQEGETAPVDSVLAIIGPEGTDVSGIAENYKKDGAKSAETTQEKPKEAAADDEKSDEPVETVSDGKRIFISPLAKKIASEKGINISKVKGSGENGRIVKADIENYTPAKEESQPQAEKAQAPAAKPYVPAGETSTESIPNSQMR